MVQEREDKIVSLFYYKDRAIVIVQCKWNKKVIKVAPGLRDYCNGYVSVKKKWYHRWWKPDYRIIEDLFNTEELTFSGYLGDLPNLPTHLAGVWFVGFDSAHYWNIQNPESATEKAVTKRAKKLCNEMIKKGY